MGKTVITSNGYQPQKHYCSKCRQLRKKEEAVIFMGEAHTPYGLCRIVVCNTCFVGDAANGDITPNTHVDQNITFMSWFTAMLNVDSKEAFEHALGLHKEAAKAFDITITGG